MIPELPRAPSSAARAPTRAIAERLGQRVGLQRVVDRARRLREVRAGVAVGHREDVDVVDARGVSRERAGCAGGGEAHESERIAGGGRSGHRTRW